MLLTRESILNARDLKVEKVELEDWGGHVFIRVISGRERDKYETYFAQKTNKVLEDVRTKLAVLVICDEAGSPYFTEEDVKALGDKSGAMLDKVFDAALALNKMGKTYAEEVAGN